MKKTMVSLFVLMLFAGFIGNVYAATKRAPKYDIVIGKVVSIDMVKNTFVLKVTKTHEDKTLSAAATIIAKLKVGEDVKLCLTLGTDVVVKVKVKAMPKPAAPTVVKK